MTRAERLEKQKAATRAKIEALQKREAHLAAAQREDDRKMLHRRHIAVGKLAEQAGLFVYDDVTLAAKFAALIGQTPPSKAGAVNGTQKREKVGVSEGDG